MDRAQAVLVTLVAYKVALIVIGILSQRRTRSGEDFFLGGRTLGPTVAAVSASASSSSAWTLLGVSGFAYSYGLSALWLFPACVGGFALNWCLLAPALRRYRPANDALTVTEVLAASAEGRLRSAITILASAIVMVFMTAYVASQFQGAGKTFAETFGLAIGPSILVGGVIVVFYTLIGGFWAVSLTDTLQGLVMAATSIILPVAALVAVGGPAGLADGLRGVEVEGLLSLTRGMGPATAVGFVFGLLGIGLGYPGQPHVVNRFMALKEGERQLRIARLVAMGWAVVVYAGMVLLGLCGRVLFTALADKEVVFLAAANRLFHPVVAGVMVAAVLSAIMSTADSQLLVTASAVTHDLGAGRRRMLPRSRLTVLVLSGAALLAALYGPREIFTPVLVAWSVMGAAFGPLLLVTVLRGPVSGARTMAAMSTGLVLTIAGGLIRASVGDWGAFAERVVPFLAATAVAAWPRRQE
jgi:sodium/proline symporter